jgi:predicted metal-dependent peptidase
MALTQEERIKRAHIKMMKHPETALYSGVMMMGTTKVVDEEGMTACADTKGNKMYGRKFLETHCKDDSEINALVLHENLHVALRHMIHGMDMFKEDRARANKAADYVVNDIIVSLQDKTLCKLPEGGCYDPKYHNMSMRQVYKLLEEEEKNGGGGSGGNPRKGGQSNDGEYQFDDHDIDGDASSEDMKDMNDKVDRALREGALLAGRLGVDLPRAITDILTPQVNWREALRDFVTASCKGKDEFTWRRFNRRLLPSDIYLPTVENETIGEVVVAIDTSGSIGQEQINEFATELVSICELVEPDSVRVLWWDTMVHGEQIFTNNYQNIGGMLKPLGGGGTKVGCVSEYINEKKINAECVIVFTDGYVEREVEWKISAPTLWFVTENKDWDVPSGKKVIFNN